MKAINYYASNQKLEALRSELLLIRRKIMRHEIRINKLDDESQAVKVAIEHELLTLMGEKK